jgi:hypothetical protein
MLLNSTQRTVSLKVLEDLVILPRWFSVENSKTPSTFHDSKNMLELRLKSLSFPKIFSDECGQTVALKQKLGEQAKLKWWKLLRNSRSLIDNPRKRWLIIIVNRFDDGFFIVISNFDRNSGGYFSISVLW